MSRRLEKPGDHPPFALAKRLFAMKLENIIDGTACRGFDFTVRIDELEAEPDRKAPADRTLARTHQPHQHDRAGAALDWDFLAIVDRLNYAWWSTSRIHASWRVG